MKFGNLTNPSFDILKEIRRIGEMGFDFAEIGIEGPEGMPDTLLKKRREILGLLKRYDMFALAHTAWWIELGTPYESVRKAWIEEVKKKIIVANELNIKKVNIHSHSHGLFLVSKKSKKKILDLFIESLNELIGYSKKFGIQIMLENAMEKHDITDVEDFSYIVDSVSSLAVHLDIGHAFIHGGMNSVKNWISTFGNKIEHIHIHDNHGKSDEHLPLGKGKINFPAVVRELKRIGYDKTITFEVFTKNPHEIKNSMNHLKKLWG